MSESVSRRTFLQTTSAAAASAQSPPPPSRAAALRQLSEHLFVFDDTCQVYLIRDGEHGLLIDFGSGAILPLLRAAAGVTKIDWILHTHHHRDQAQGDPLAVAQNIPIAVPAHERHLFADVERFWANRRVNELYYVANNSFSLTQSIPVAALLEDYSTFRWRGYSFFVQPTPGHTPGSISLIATIDGRKVVFSGDLIAAPGRVQTLYDLQYYYGEHEGVDLAIYSLDELLKAQPDLLCPSHGEPLPQPAEGIKLLREKMAGWFRFWHPGGSLPASDIEPVALTPHVLAYSATTSSFYAIISETGRALLIDYGCASWTFFQAFLQAADTYDRMRFVEHNLDKLRAKHGLRNVDVAVCTHLHDDHLNGFPYLARRYGTEIWCYENMVEQIENPRGRHVGCTFGAPMKPHRVLREGETFRWQEFEFTVHHSPGHTQYQMALFATIDGKKIAFTGDAFFGDGEKTRAIRHNLIYRNDVQRGDYLKVLPALMAFAPDVIAPGHGEPFPVNPTLLQQFADRMKLQDRFFSELIADPDTEVGLDPSWVQIYPYQALATPGQPCQLEIRARNHRARPVSLEVSLVLPAGWRAEPSVVTLQVPGQGRAQTPVRITATTGAKRRVAIAADVYADGRHLGQIAEAMVDLRGANARS